MEKPFLKVKLIEKKEIAQEVLDLKFEKPIGFNFLAGQFVQFMIKTDLESVLRSYSIASEPSEEYLEFCVKLVPNGKGAQFFSKLNIGEEAFLRGPEGRFVCLEAHSATKFFVATGAGIAPIMGMIKQDLKNQISKEVSLLFGVRHKEDIIWQERLEELQNLFNHFSFKITLSKPDKDWTGNSGRVTSHIASLLKPEAEYYLCGSLEMVKDMRVILSEKGVDIKKIHFEIF
jgi:ferredoxin-NADP reductase